MTQQSPELRCASVCRQRLREQPHRGSRTMVKSLNRSALIVLCVVFICSCGRVITFAQGMTTAQVTRSTDTQGAAVASAQTSATKPGAAARSHSQTNFAPLTANEKMKRAFKSAFLSPVGYAFTALSATIT